MSKRFYDLHFGKPSGMLGDILLDVQGVLSKTDIRIGRFEFNGKEVIVNTDTKLEWGDIVLKKIGEGDPKPYVDIRG